MAVWATFPTALTAGFDLVLRRKALGAEVLAIQRDTVLGGKYPALEPQVREWTTLRRQTGRKRLDGPGRDDPQEHQRLLASWENRQEQLEAALARHIPEMNLAQHLRTVDRYTVARALPVEAVLIEFVRFTAYDFHAVPQRGEAVWQAARYGAFVMRAEAPEDVQLIDLGEAVPIERMIAAFRASLPGGDRQLHIAAATPSESPSDGAALRAAIFDPLVPALRGHTRLFLAPDGDLTRLPFEVLPSAEGRRLIDTYRLSYLSTGRDVLRFAVSAPVTPMPALVLADPDFDLEEAAPVRPEEGRAFFTRLPGTRLEGERVAAMLGVQPWLDRTALKPRLMASHIAASATYGDAWLFSPGPLWHEDRRSCGRMAAPPGTAPQPSPVAFRAGPGGCQYLAQERHAPGRGDNGILHAEDVATLDLVATELVVLSACDTGLGEVQVGEGVFGLRRAFVLAGAKTLVMSLWKVPDKQTQELMVEFYHRLLAGQSRADALREAQLALKARYPEPWYWGGFICQGNPNPLPRLE